MLDLKKFLKLILFLAVICGVGTLQVSAAKNPYKQEGPYGTNCTWYAWKMANEKVGISLPGWGNAKDWYNDAKQDGYTVGTTPKANSIIVWGDWTSYGHVGYVEAVEGNILHIWDSTGPCIDEEDPEYIECMANGVSEESDKICKANAKRIACEYTISPSDYVVTGYIYLDYAPKKEISTSTSKDNNTNSTGEKVKSSNANLSNIVLSGGSINFNKEIFEYVIEVENEIDKITINALTEDKKATVEGSGDYELKIGSNEIKLKVTAEDKSTKQYVVKIIRKEKIENRQDVDENTELKEKMPTKANNEKTIKLIRSICIIFVLIMLLILVFKKNNKLSKDKEEYK